MLELKKICAGYGKKQILTDLSLSFSNNGKTWEISLAEDFTNALMGDLSAALTEFDDTDAENALQ